MICVRSRRGDADKRNPEERRPVTVARFVYRDLKLVLQIYHLDPALYPILPTCCYPLDFLGKGNFLSGLVREIGNSRIYDAITDIVVSVAACRSLETSLNARQCRR